MITLPLGTPVIFVNEDGTEKPAKVHGDQNSPGTARIAFDPEGNDTALAAYSEGGEPGTFHIDRGEGDAGAAQEKKPKKFQPGGAAAAKKPAATPAEPVEAVSAPA